MDMLSDNNGSAADRALRVLRSSIDKVEGQGMRRLPTIAALAAEAGVSLAVMCQCVRTLVTQGRIRSRPRAGLTLVDSTEPASPQPRRLLRRVVDVREYLIRATADGTFAYGSALPPAKSLAAAIGVSQPTVTKALAGLIEDKAIVRQGRRFVNPRPESRRGSAGRLVLVMAGDAEGTPMMVTSRTPTHMQAIEQACISHGLSLELLTCNQLQNAISARASARGRSLLAGATAADVVGFAIWPLAFYPPESARNIPEWCASSGRPVAILDERSDDSDLRLRPPHGCRVFALDMGEMAGYRIGCHLRTLGHRRVAFVHPGIRGDVMGQRAEGILRALRETWGERAEVTVVCDNRDADHGKLMRLRNEAFAVLREHGSANLSGCFPRGEQTPAEASDDHMWRVIEHIEYEQRLGPLMEQALAVQGVTALVGSSDRWALNLLAGVRASGGSRGGKLSVVGFDNGVDGAIRQLTSYDFGGVAAISAMVDCVARPRRSPFARDPLSKIVVMPGTVVTRGTVTPTRCH